MISHLAAEEKDARETCRLVRDAGRTAAAVPGDIRDGRGDHQHDLDPGL
ncbi:hypothetical protein OG558_35520 [Kribbella sp. NBC_01510]